MKAQNGVFMLLDIWLMKKHCVLENYQALQLDAGFEAPGSFIDELCYQRHGTWPCCYLLLFLLYVDKNIDSMD